MTNYISFQAIERVNAKEETCIFVARHSGIDLAVENHPEFNYKVRIEEAFDTTNWWLLDRQTGRPTWTNRQIQRSSVNTTQQSYEGLLHGSNKRRCTFKITQRLLIWFNRLCSRETLALQLARGCIFECNINNESSEIETVTLPCSLRTWRKTTLPTAWAFICGGRLCGRWLLH